MIEIYTRDGCNQCVDIKQFLSTKNVDYTEVKVGIDVERDEIVSKFPEQKSLPIVVLAGDVIGTSELKSIIESEQLVLF